jgi:hypothetical protein
MSQDQKITSLYVAPEQAVARKRPGWTDHPNPQARHVETYEEHTVKTSEYARMAEYEQSYWWHLGRLEIIQLYMKRAVRNKPTSIILNVGCSTGGTINA